MTTSPLSISPEDSNRFALTVIRGTVTEETPAKEVLASMLALDADIAIFRCPAGSTGQVRHLMDNGYIPIHADTLVYYSRSLRNSPPAPIQIAGIEASLAIPSEQQAISEIARLCFSGYRSHYFANPLLDSQLILEGYVEWAQAHLAANDLHRDTWVIRMAGHICGFATCSINPETSTVEIVLNAVAPDHMGRGLYGHMLNAIIRHYSQRDLSTLMISTQIWNYVVQRAWSRAGLALQRAFDTYHVNAIRHHSGN